LFEIMLLHLLLYVISKSEKNSSLQDNHIIKYLAMNSIEITIRMLILFALGFLHDLARFYFNTGKDQ